MMQRLTLRRAFHDLINKNGSVLLPAGLIAEDFKALLAEKAKGNLDPDIKKVLEEAVSDLKDIEADSKLTDKLIKQIKQFVYTKLDPDQTELDIDL